MKLIVQIITGGTGGIGGGSAKMLLAEGANVGLLDVIPSEKGDAFAKEISSDGRAIYIRVDITDDAAVKEAVSKVVERYGNLRGCVHCAGIALKRDWTNDASESIPNFKKVSLWPNPGAMKLRRLMT